MPQVIRSYQYYWSHKHYTLSVLFGFLIMIPSAFISYVATEYATNGASNPVNDIFLDHLPFIDLGVFLAYGALISLFSLAVIIFSNPKSIPFALKCFAVFILIRAFFTMLTHIGLFPGQISFGGNNAFETIIKRAFLGADYFFSGHTGMPFLAALIYWDHKIIRVGCLILSVVFGYSVLVSHLHYSIDVFAAYFMAFGIFHIATHLFHHDYLILKRGL